MFSPFTVKGETKAQKSGVTDSGCAQQSRWDPQVHHCDPGPAVRNLAFALSTKRA